MNNLIIAAILVLWLVPFTILALIVVISLSIDIIKDIINDMKELRK